jgi:hypothetical protein
MRTVRYRAERSVRLRRGLSVLILGLAAALWADSAAAAGDPRTPAPDFLCTGRIQARYASRCPQVGPAAAAVSKTVEPPLPTTSIDPGLAYLPFRYIRLGSDDPTWLYTSAEDAREGVNAYRPIEAGFDYVSWLQCQIVDGKAIYMIAPGIYLRGGSDCSQIGTSNFHGLQFYRQPQRTFGWVLSGTYTMSEPGTEKATQNWVNRYQVVFIYDQQEIGNLVWYRIGPSDWIEQRLIAVVEPDRTKPDGVEGDRWISINLYEQTISAYENGQLVYATLASTGLRGWWTQPGSFQVYAKLERDDMSGSFEADRSDYYFLQDVPWVLYYDKARAIHGAYWHNGYGYPRSHGCVNLSPTDSRWFYQWADEGTWVNVYDPSGQTPTDKELYGAGGA